MTEELFHVITQYMLIIAVGLLLLIGVVRVAFSTIDYVDDIIRGWRCKYND